MERLQHVGRSWCNSLSCSLACLGFLGQGEWKIYSISIRNRNSQLSVLCCFVLQSIAHVTAPKNYFLRLPVNLVIRNSNSQPIVKMTAKEFMMGYESPLTTLGNTLLPHWIHFDKVGLIDRVSANIFCNILFLINCSISIRCTTSPVILRHFSLAKPTARNPVFTIHSVGLQTCLNGMGSIAATSKPLPMAPNLRASWKTTTHFCSSERACVGLKH